MKWNIYLSKFLKHPCAWSKYSSKKASTKIKYSINTVILLGRRVWEAHLDQSCAEHSVLCNLESVLLA